MKMLSTAPYWYRHLAYCQYHPLPCGKPIDAVAQPYHFDRVLHAVTADWWVVQAGEGEQVRFALIPVASILEGSIGG